MRSPSTSELLDTWERGMAIEPVERGLLLLALANPEFTGDALAAVPIAERDRRVLALRAAVFGANLTGLVACEACGDQLEIELGVDELCTFPPAPLRDLTLAADDYEIWLRQPDSRDLLEAAARPAAESGLHLLRRCVVRAEREAVEVAVDDLPASLVEAAGTVLAEADPLSDPRFALTCMSCGHAWQAPFDAVAFLWAELDAWARRMLREVHALALAYGWSEREILGLGAARRMRYLQMVQG